MAIVHPFRALRPAKARVAQVAAPPYDVVSTEEARALAAGNDLSFLHVSRPEIDLPEGTNIYADEVYVKACENFQRLIESCPLEREDEPSLYLYKLKMGEHEQTGLVAACSVDEYDEGLIKKHEHTRPDKENDRTRHITETKAQTGPVFLTYQGDKEIDQIVANVAATESLYDFTAADDVRHTIWRATVPAAFVEAFKQVPALYIADGHHRAASASRTRAEMQKLNPNHTGDEDYNRFLAVLFPADQMQILPYNRVVKDLNGMDADEFLNRVRETFDVTENAKQKGPGKRGHFHLYLDKHWYGLTPREAAPDADVVAALDVSVLQNNLLDPILGIKDVRTDKRIDFVGGIRGTGEIERLVDSGQMACGFALFATTVEELLQVSDAGQIMPPKSTWFEPKLRDGILIHTI